MARRLKLIRTAIARLEPEDGKQIIYWDTEQPGFGVRVSPGRIVEKVDRKGSPVFNDDGSPAMERKYTKTFIVQGRCRGKEIKVAIGRHPEFTPEQAREIAGDYKRMMSRGNDPREEKEKEKVFTVTLKEVADDYIKDRSKDNSLKPTTINDINRHINGNFSSWANRPISQITRNNVVDMHAEISKRGKAHANQAFRYLRALFNYAIPKYRADNAPAPLENPVDVLSELKLWNKIAPREIRIFDNKIGAAWNHLQELRKSSFQTATSRCSTDLICFLLLTGTRWSEAANLRWDHVNLEEGWFFLENTKNSDSVTLPLSDTLRDILESRPRDSEYVFPARSGKGPIKDIRGAFSKLANAIEMDKLSAHDLRRTYTNIAWKKCRIPLDVVKLLTNHRLTTDVTIEHYSDKGDMRFLADEANQVAGWIEEQATEPE